MRETSGTTWTFGLMITFIFLFSTFLIATLSYSKAFKVKNEVLSIIEKYEGYTSEGRQIVNNYLNYNNYKATGFCDDGYYGEDSLTDNDTIELAESGKRYLYCIKEETAPDGLQYYKVKFFFRFNLPVLGQISTFDVTGTTINVDGEYSILSDY